MLQVLEKAIKLDLITKIAINDFYKNLVDKILFLIVI